MCEKITSVCQVLKGMHTEENGFSFLLHGVADLRVGLYCLRPIHPRSIQSAAEKRRGPHISFRRWVRSGVHARSHAVTDRSRSIKLQRQKVGRGLDEVRL